MDTLTALVIITIAGLLHATFQLSVSVLTLLSGHAIGNKKSQAKLFRLTTAFLVGASVMTLLLISSATLFSLNLFGPEAAPIVWAIASGIVIGVGISVWMFYYRRDKGTMLWIPRSIAGYLHDRTKHTSNSAEAFALGTMGVVGELLFTLAPLVIGALTIIQLNPSWQLVGLGIYVLTASLPLIVMWMLIGGGHKISELQKWREDNKYFLQFVAGSGLIVLGFYVYLSEVVTVVGGV